jgi:hypothetical protein
MEYRYSFPDRTLCVSASLFHGVGSRLEPFSGLAHSQLATG